MKNESGLYPTQAIYILHLKLIHLLRVSLTLAALWKAVVS